MAMKMPKTLQLDLISVEAFDKPIKHSISPERADWWFGQVRQVVDSATDWSKVFSISPRQEQILSSPTNRPVISDNDPLRCSSHYNCRGPWRFRR